MKNKFDVVVVGGGHAGVEAALAAGRLGLGVLMATTRISRISYMACNPSIGGLAKGNLVKEIDVLGGVMGLAGDFACLQYKHLNSKKGPAVRGSRVQCDKQIYQDYVQNYLRRKKNIYILEKEAEQLLINQNKCRGVLFKDGSCVYAQAVILTTGTFMGAVMHVGSRQTKGGRRGDQATYGLSRQMKSLGFQVTRLKTGTPPRLHRDSINWSKLAPQKGDKQYRPLSFFSPSSPSLPQISCYLTHTHVKTHEVIQKNLKKSPLFLGIIQGTGPRYCPSIEDKVVRFPEKTSHQTFLEPENLNGSSIYVQGLSTSLPQPVQEQFIRTIPGLEQAQFLQWGYAVEYDFINPIQVQPTLESKNLPHLFLAGQINGSSGYEEAAAQGLMAGINAGFQILNLPELILPRHQAYTGVLIDDLVTKGTSEPYRMLTSRAEYRLILREDNTAERLFSTAQKYKLLSEEKIKFFEALLAKREKYREQLLQFKWSSQELNKTFFSSNDNSGKNQDQLEGNSYEKTSHSQLKSCFREGEAWTAYQLLKRPDFSYKDLKQLGFQASREIAEPVEIEIKYKGYIDIQNQTVKKNQKLGKMRLQNVQYDQVKSLSSEAREKLQKVRPLNLDQALRISGVGPADVQSLIIHVYRRKRMDKNNKKY